MTPRERVEAVLRGEVSDRIPFTIYPNHLPPTASAEAQLLDAGVCIVRGMSVFRTVSPNVRVETVNYTEDGVEHRRKVHHTPVGDVFTIDVPAGYTSWHVKKLFGGPEDYKPLLFMIKDQQFEPDYERFLRGQQESGEQYVWRAGIAPNPLHQIMIHWMGVATFAVEWAERRDEIEELYEAMVENHRKLYPIVAQSPALHANYGGNETGFVMGRERFAKYVGPLHEEAAEEFHKHGKFIGTHLDGDNKVWADLVAGSSLDYIEAFSPAPTSDLTIEEGFAAWPDKLLWINFPSVVHLHSADEIAATTRRIIQASQPDHRLIIGTTEYIPMEHREKSLLTIAKVINSEGLRCLG